MSATQTATLPFEEEIKQRLDVLLDPPGVTRKELPVEPPDPAFAEHFNHVIAEIRGVAAEITSVAAQLPSLEVIEQHLQAVGEAKRGEREHDLLYMLIGAQVTLEQARNWLQRVLRAGT